MRNAASSPLASASVNESVLQGLPFGKVLSTVRRHALLIAMLGVLGAGGAYIYARTLPKFYTASSLIAVAGSSFAIPELQGALRAETAADPMPIVRTEMQALTSRDLVARMVRELQLERLPEFNSDLRPPTWIAIVKSRLQSLLPATNGNLTAGDAEQGVISAAISAIRIFQDNRSLAIDVGFVSESPELSAKAANTLVADYMSVRAMRQNVANTGANEVLTQRIEQVRTDVAGLEAKIQQLRSTNEVVMLRAGSVGQQKLEDLVTASAKATLDRGQLEASYNSAIATSVQGSSAALSSVLSSPTITQLREREAAASQRIAELSSRYGSSHPGVASAQAELAAARSQVSKEVQRIISSLGTQLRIARERETDIQQQLDETRRTAVASENTSAELKQLQDEVVSRQKLYQTLLEQMQRTTGQPAGDRTPDVYVISTAAPPGSPSSPNLRMSAGFGGIAGITLGCLFAIARLDSLPRAASLEELKQQLAGTVGADLLRRARTGAPLTISDLSSLSTITDHWSKIGQSARPKVMLVAGTSENDMAGLLAVVLARAAFQRGDSAVLIDTNLARPLVSAGFPGINRDLVAMLRGDHWPDPAGPGTQCLEYYGALKALPAALPELTGSIFVNLLTQTRDTFDTVVLVAPPTGTPEMSNLARQTDFTLVVVGPGSPDIVSPGSGPFAVVRITA